MVLTGIAINEITHHLSYKEKHTPIAADQPRQEMRVWIFLKPNSSPVTFVMSVSVFQRSQLPRGDLPCLSVLDLDTENMYYFSVVLLA